MKFENLTDLVNALIYFRHADMIPELQSFLPKVWRRILMNLIDFQFVDKYAWLNDFICTGRLYQVEYAMEAISHAGTCLGILAKDGILLAAERRNTNKLLDGAIFSEKIYKLNE